MKCEDMLRLLNDYVDGQIDPAVCDDFERHLAGCNPCKIVIDNIRKTITLYKGEEAYELGQDWDWQQSLGLTSDCLSSKEARLLEPALAAEVRLAVRSPDAGAP